ncbi:MAG: MerR family transcriptional regulator [Clostridia bacterium]|nr:MerR family transcriptional regulator [Clostridia bacterium]
MYKIGELSKLCKIPVKTLRFYDAQGILTPDETDDFTGYRYYSAKKLSDCYRILMLKELGFSLAEIKDWLTRPNEQLEPLVAAKEQELCEQLQQTEQRLTLLRRLQRVIREDETMFDIVVRPSEAIKVLYDRRIVRDKREADEVIAALCRAVPKDRRGLRTVMIDYEMEYVTEDMDIGCGVEITGTFSNAEYAVKTIAFDADTASVVCSEADHDEAVQALHRYTKEHDCQIVGPLMTVMYEDGTEEVKLPVVRLGAFDEGYNEDIETPFENDDEVIGRWEVVDALYCREMFHPQKRKVNSNQLGINELYFLPHGEWYWCFGWTKGYLLSFSGYPNRKSRNRYTVEHIDGETYMFLEFKTSDYFQGGKPEVGVLKKVDSKAYTKQEIGRRDELPGLPADDAAVLGVWHTCDLVRTVESFDANAMCSFIPHRDLYWRQAEFENGGTMKNGFRGEDGLVTDPPEKWRWVNGYVICTPQQTASRYIIRNVDGTDYLFIEWKSGDYIYNGDIPFWCVFKR